METPFAQHCRRSLRGGNITGLAHTVRFCDLNTSSDACKNYMVMVLVTYYCRSTYMETAEYIVKRKHIHILITSSPFLSVPPQIAASRSTLHHSAQAMMPEP